MKHKTLFAFMALATLALKNDGPYRFVPVVCTQADKGPSNGKAVFSTDYELARRLEITEARVAYIHLLPWPASHGKVHSAWIFTTKDKRMLTFTGLPEREPYGLHFLDVGLPSAEAYYLGASTELTYDQGPIVAGVYEIPEFVPGDKHSDSRIVRRDSANYGHAKQGIGLKGLSPSGNVKMERMDSKPGEAQIIYSKALEVGQLVDAAKASYAAFPSNENEFNSHSITFAVAKAAEETGKIGGLTAAIEQLGYFPGANMPGTSLARLRKLAKDSQEGKPAPQPRRGQELADCWTVHYAHKTKLTGPALP